MTEAQWSSKMKARAKEIFHGIVIFKLSTPYVTALPDSSYTYRGFTTWVEVKREYNDPTKLQLKVMADLYRENGGRAYFIRVLDEHKPVQWQVRSGHDWNVLVLHSSTLDNMLHQIVQWRK